MTNRVFFYIGSILHGADTDEHEEGWAAAAAYFEATLKGDVDRWYHLLEMSADNAAKQTKPTNMCFRLFAGQWAGGGREGNYSPPGLDDWDAPDYLYQPFSRGTAKAWEFICSSIDKEKVMSQVTYNIKDRSDRADVLVSRNVQGKYTLAPGHIGPALSDCSGRVLKAELDVFIDILKDKLPYPLYSVSDCNTFHTTGYLWGKYALDRSGAVGSQDGVLIIDLDQHNDAGSAGAIISSDGWGKPLLNCYDNSAYAVVGTAASEDTNVNVYAAYRKGGGLIRKINCKAKKNQMMDGTQVETNITPRLLKSGTLADLVTALTKLIDDLEDLTETPFKHFYLTVDRDCMFGSRTQWGDRSVTFEDPDEVIRVIDVLVAVLGLKRNVRLAGLDVTGLPDAKTNELKMRSKLLNKTDTREFSAVATDLTEEIGKYDARFMGWSLNSVAHRIEVAAAVEEDGVDLSFSMKHQPSGAVINELKLGEDGKLDFMGRLIDYRIKFDGEDSFRVMELGATANVGDGGTHTFKVKAV